MVKVINTFLLRLVLAYTYVNRINFATKLNFKAESIISSILFLDLHILLELIL